MNAAEDILFKLLTEDGVLREDCLIMQSPGGGRMPPSTYLCIVDEAASLTENETILIQRLVPDITIKTVH